MITGDEMTIFNSDTGNDEYLVDSLNEVTDLRSERKSKRKPKNDDSLEETPNEHSE